MGFAWTSPNPLDDHTVIASFIGNKVRNVVGTFAIYLSEIQDAINVVRSNIGQPEIEWGLNNYLYVQVGDTLTWEHYDIIRDKIDTLIILYDYNSVTDILGRGWADYSELSGGKYYAKWQIIQDFRDVLDALSKKMETWESAEIPISYQDRVLRGGDSGGNFWFDVDAILYNFNADLGTWIGVPYRSHISLFQNVPFVHATWIDAGGNSRSSGYGKSWIMGERGASNAVMRFHAESIGEEDSIISGAGSQRKIYQAPTMMAYIESESLDLQFTENDKFTLTININSYQEAEINAIYRQSTDEILFPPTFYSNINYPTFTCSLYLINEDQTDSAKVNIIFSGNETTKRIVGYTWGRLDVYYPATTQIIDLDLNNYLLSYLNNCNIIKHIELEARTYIQDSNFYNIISEYSSTDAIIDISVDDIGLLRF